MSLLIEIIKFLFYAMLIVLISKYVLVRILRKIGELLRLKPKTIGNIAGVATSIPELLTVSFSAFTGLILASTYNILSSNIINTLQYGIAVILNKNQRELQNKAIKVDLVLVATTIIIPMIMMLFQIENKIEIVPIFIILFIIFYKITNNAHKLYYHHGAEEKNIDEVMIENREESAGSHISIEGYTKKGIAAVVFQGILLAIVGIALYIIGNLLSNVLDHLCTLFHIPQMIIGILLGFITSLPELITFFESQRHHEEDKEGVIEATSNLLTSNIMNLFIIQSIGILIYYMIQ